MDPRLDELAVRLQECRRKGNRMTLQCVLESARILREAKARAKREFGKWLAEKGHMAPSTARIHLRVEHWIAANRQLTGDFANLSLAKVYALTTLDFDTARRLLHGQIRMSKPIEELSDVQFRLDFRRMFPPARRRRTRQHAYQQLHSALVRATRAVYTASKFESKFTLQQRRKLHELYRNLVEGGTYLKRAI
jgi:hypothetical protein